MANINVQDVMAAYSPVVEAFDLERGQTQLADKKQMGANTAFDNRIMTEALPITRMLNSDGTANIEAIKGAGKGFSNPYDLWEELQANMPKGRGVDPVVFQEKYAMGKQMYDMNLMNQIGQMDESGLSEKEIRDTLKSNPDLYDYALNNSIIPRDDPVDWGSVGVGTLAAVGGLGGAIGAERIAANLMNRTFAEGASRELSGSLRDKGFQRKGKFGIKKLSDRQIARDLGVEKDVDLRPTKKDGTPDKRTKKKFGHSTENKQKIRDYKKARAERLKNSRQLRKAVSGSKSAGGRVLRNVPKYVTRTPCLALRLSKGAKHIPRIGGLISAGILGSAAVGGVISKLFED